VVVKDVRRASRLIGAIINARKYDNQNALLCLSIGSLRNGSNDEVVTL